VTAFGGFGKGAVAFFEELDEHNDREWWHANKHRYEADIREPLELLFADLAAEFGEAKVFRPNRDTRFSKDKTPYKLWAAGSIGMESGCGLYLSLGVDGFHVAGGGYRMARDQLAKYRDAVADDRTGPQLEAIYSTLQKAKASTGGHEALKTAPRGYPKDHPRIDLLRLDGATAGWLHPPKPWLHTKQAETKVIEGWRALRPLLDWVATNVGASELEWGGR
jgi:uncharacterized protein (TIGR02453 family)